MVEIERELNAVYAKVETIQGKLRRLQSEKQELLQQLENQAALISSLKKENLKLEKKSEEQNDQAGKIHKLEAEKELREELNQYIKVIDECLGHLKKI